MTLTGICQTCGAATPLHLMMVLRCVQDAGRRHERSEMRCERCHARWLEREERAALALEAHPGRRA